MRAREELVIREVLSLFPRPASIKGIEIEFGEDHSGDPAVRIWLIVPKNLPLKGPKWEAAFSFCERLGRALVEKRLRHWPYVNMRTRSLATA